MILDEVDFTNNDMSEAIFQDCYITSSIFKNSTFKNTRLNEAKIYDCQFENISFENITNFDEEKVISELNIGSFEQRKLADFIEAKNHFKRQCNWIDKN